MFVNFHRIPVIKFDNNRRKKREIATTNSSSGTNFLNSFDDFDTEFEDSDEQDEEKDKKPFDPSVSLPVDLYCSIVASLDEECYESNLLELWNYNGSVIRDLTATEILDGMNHEKIRYNFTHRGSHSSHIT